MAPESRFLLLPREVRDLIYAAYFSAPGGYVSDFSSGKLRRADGEPVHLSLRYACRQIAHETNGLALQLNSVTFTTLSEDESLRARAERFNHILCELYKGHYLLLSNLGPRPSPLVNEERLEEAIRQYPEVEKLVELYMQMGRADAFWTASYLNSDYPPLEAGLKSFKQSCGQIPSTFWEGVRFVFRHAVDMPSAIQKEQRSKFFQHPERIARSVSSCPDPWMIPTEDELNAMIQGVATQSAKSLKTRYFTIKDHYYGRSRFSAAAAAIHFLRCSHPDTRRHLRKLVVNEDRKSVAFPECHAKGFVPYLEENPRLQIERVASLWQCVFQKDKLGSLLATEFDRHLNILVDKESKLPVDYITYNVAEWMAEASTLQAFNRTFRLVLDGGPVPEHTARIFQDVVQRDAAWQTAFERSFDWEGMDIKDIIALRQRNRSFNFEGFPEWVERIGKPDSVVQCNFDPGGPVDVQAIVDEHRDWSLRDWWNLWGRPGQTVDTCPPLAPWVQLIHDNVMPEWFELEDPSDSEDSLSS